MSRSRSAIRPSPSPANTIMPSACASFRSGGSSGSIAMQPETWKPPTTTGTSAARNWRPRSRARGKLVGLNPDERDESAAGGLDAPNCRADIDDRVAFVVSLDLDVDVGAESPLLGAYRQQTVDAGEAVRGDGRTPPLDDVTVLVVVGRLEKNDPKRSLAHSSPSSRGGRTPIASASSSTPLKQSDQTVAV